MTVVLIALVLPALCPCIPAVMSANEQKDTVFQAIKGGAEEYLVKPVTRKEVQNIWQYVWKRLTATQLQQQQQQQQPAPAQPQQQQQAQVRRGGWLYELLDVVALLHALPAAGG